MLCTFEPTGLTCLLVNSRPIYLHLKDKKIICNKNRYTSSSLCKQLNTPLRTTTKNAAVRVFKRGHAF